MDKYRVGQHWKTRAGRTAVVQIVTPGDVLPVRGVVDGNTMYWSDAGRFMPNEIEHALDLVKLVSLAPRLFIVGPKDKVEASATAAAKYRRQGFIVLNPTEGSEGMRADLQGLVQCDEVVLLDGWTRSREALIEHQIAIALKMKVTYAY